MNLGGLLARDKREPKSSHRKLGQKIAMDGARVVELEKPIGDAISRIRFAPSSNNLLVASWDSVLRLYDVDGSAVRFEGFSEGATLDCCFEDESAALSASSDGCIRRYDLCSGSQTILGRHAEPATRIEYSKETSQVITAGLDKKLVFWDIHMKDRNSGCTRMLDSEVWSMSLCGLHLLAATRTGLNMYDLRNINGPVQSKKSSLVYQIQCVSSFSSCRGYAVGSVDGFVELKYFDASKASETGCVFRCHPKSKDGRDHLVAVNDIRFHPCYDTFVTGDNDGYAIIWNAETKKRLFELGRYPNSVASISYNHRAEILAVASSYTYQDVKQEEAEAQIFIHELDNLGIPCASE